MDFKTQPREKRQEPMTVEILKMDGVLTRLLGLLERETDNYRSLHSVVQREKEAILQADLTAFNEAGKEKDNLLLTLRIIEEQRIPLLNKIADALDYPRQELTLSKLSGLIEEPYAGRLKKCSANLFVLIEKIQQVSQQNKDLLTHSLQLLRGSINLLNHLMATNPVYYRTGDIQGSKPTGRLMCGEI